MASVIDKEKALQLRADGHSLQEVADELGCSLAWCKVNLKGTKPVNKDLELVEQVRVLGRSKDGVTNSQVKELVRHKYNKLDSKELELKVSDIKRAARRDNKDVIIRPHWMLPDDARACTTDMLEFAQEVYELKNYLAKKYRRIHDLDEGYHNGIIYGLTMMSAGEYNKLMPQGLLTYGRQLGAMQDALEERHTGVKVLEPKGGADDYTHMDFSDDMLPPIHIDELDLY